MVIAQQKDAQKIVNLVNSVYRGEKALKSWTTEAALIDGQRVDVEMINQIISDPTQVILLLEEDNQLIGCVNLQKKSETECFLGMLSVSLEHQGQGIAKKIIEYCENFARNYYQSKKMVLFVITVRQELMSFYERRGYTRTGQTHDFPYGEPKWGLPKVLGLKLEKLEKKLH